jgi:hypothetical protein
MNIDCHSGDHQKPGMRSEDTAHPDRVYGPVEHDRDCIAPIRCSGRIGLPGTPAGMVRQVNGVRLIQFSWPCEGFGC